MNPPLKLGQPRFLSKEEVVTLHRGSLDAYGGADGFLNEGGLDSALAQARQGFGSEYAHGFPFGMAAAYGFHIAMNHPFRDGNKRTAFAAMVAFLRMNGWNFQLPDSEGAGLMLELIAQRRDKQWLSAQVEANCRPRVSLELRDFFGLFDYESAKGHVVLASASKPPELNATVYETMEALPIARDLHNLLLQHQRDGADDAGKRVLTALVFFIAAYRFAEDMGYEW